MGCYMFLWNVGKTAQQDYLNKPKNSLFFIAQQIFINDGRILQFMFTRTFAYLLNQNLHILKNMIYIDNVEAGIFNKMYP